MTDMNGHAGRLNAGLLPCLLLALAAFAGAANAQNNANNGRAADPNEAKAEAARQAEEALADPDPEDPITVDFVRKDIHTVMHYIGLRSGLQIQIQGTVDANLTVMYRKVKPIEAIDQICKANELDFVRDGKFIIIKRRVAAAGLANVVKGDADGRYNVAFEAQELVAAIMEVARVTNTQVFIPALPETSTATPGGPGGPVRTPQQEQQGEQRVQQVQQRRVSMYMRNAEPDLIIRRLAEVGAMRVVFKDGGYHFTYEPVADPDSGGTSGPTPDQGSLVTKDWFLPGVDVTALSGQIQNMLSTRGRLLFDQSTRYIMVTDREDIVARIDQFLTRVGDAAVTRDRLAAEAANDPMQVIEISLIRDVNDNNVREAINAMLSEQGRATINPENNTVVIYDRQSRLADLRRYIRSFDMMPQQVWIDAKLVEVGLESYMGYGLQLFSTQPVDSWKDGVVTGNSRDSGSGTVGGLFGNPTGFNPFVGTFVNQVIDARLELLANDGRVKTLSQPKQLVSNRRQARIEVGQEIPYIQSQTTGTGTGTQTASVTFREVSIVMEVRPTIFEQGIVRLEITVTVREVIGNAALEGNNTPILSLRESRTDVYMRDGETMVMGGLLRERERMDENGLPFLKDIPFVGYLFKSANKSISKTDLMFFLRPTVINALAPEGEDTKNGISIARDLTPAIDQDGDADLANLRPGNFRKLGKAAKPAHYNESARPKKAADVKPGA
ncbi:MAG: hypothetical protein HS108_13960 [Planctomycetes bacterium]|nr:hypothetical protein [Planctomycetota bacterium]MCL4730260.1 hypothetical protein [Planctomycetota bacterium]